MRLRISIVDLDRGLRLVIVIGVKDWDWGLRFGKGDCEKELRIGIKYWDCRLGIGV